MGQQLVYLILATVHQLHHAPGRPGFFKQLDQAGGGERVLLRGLEHEGIAAGHGHGEHPQRNHGREIERGNAQAHAQRLRVGIAVDAIGHVLHRLAHHQAGNIGGVLHHLDAAPHITHGIFHGLAQLLRDDGGDLGLMLLEQLLVLEHEPGAGADGGILPGLEGLRGGGHRLVDLGARGAGQLGQHVLRGRVGHGDQLGAGALPPFAIYIEGDLCRECHKASLLYWQGALCARVQDWDLT